MREGVWVEAEEAVGTSDVPCQRKDLIVASRGFIRRRTGAIVQDEVHAPSLGHFLRHDSRNEVRSAARRIGDDEADRFGRILRLRESGYSEGGEKSSDKQARHPPFVLSVPKHERPRYRRARSRQSA
jgi:hypothetical protein